MEEENQRSNSSGWWKHLSGGRVSISGFKSSIFGKNDRDINSQASQVFGALRKSIFLDKNLSSTTKRKL